MKRILVVVFILIATASFSPFAPSVAAETWAVRTGLIFTPGLVFNGAWDPGYNGTAVTISLVRWSGRLLLEAGVEAGYSYTGLNLFSALQAGVTVAGDETLRLSGTAVILPGIILSRPSPYFLMAAEITARLTWAVTPEFNLSLAVGPRYTTSPGYSAAVAPLELIDLTLGLAAGFVR